MRLGFEIPLNVFGKGLHIFHTGNIIINGTSSVGEYCNIIGSTCLGSKNGGNGPTLGDHCELGMNSVVIGNVQIGNNVYIGAGAVVTKSFEQNGVSLAGVPAKIVASRKDSKKADWSRAAAEIQSSKKTEIRANRGAPVGDGLALFRCVL